MERGLKSRANLEVGTYDLQTMGPPPKALRFPRHTSRAMVVGFSRVLAQAMDYKGLAWPTKVIRGLTAPALEQIRMQEAPRSIKPAARPVQSQGKGS